MEFIANNLAPIMFAGLICFLLIGFPVAFSLGACGLFFAVIGIEMGVLPEALMQALPLRIYGVMQNETLLAIPFFTLMGLILERSGMAEDLLDTVGQLFGPIRGGVAIAVVIVGAMLAATTGVVAASVIVPLTKTADRAWVTRLSVPSATPWNTHSSRSRRWRRRPTVKR